MCNGRSEIQVFLMCSGIFLFLVSVFEPVAEN